MDCGVISVVGCVCVDRKQSHSRLLLPKWHRQHKTKTLIVCSLQHTHSWSKLGVGWKLSNWKKKRKLSDWHCITHMLSASQSDILRLIYRDIFLPLYNATFFPFKETDQWQHAKLPIWAHFVCFHPKVAQQWFLYYLLLFFSPDSGKILLWNALKNKNWISD